MSVSSQPTYPNYAVEKVTCGRTNRILHVWFLGLLVVTALSVAMCNGEEPELQMRAECNADESTKLWEKTEHTFSRFEVGGVNLALYKQGKQAEQTKASPEAEPFELYDDFNIADQITGDESWDDLTAYRRVLERPSLSFYIDKVARKRWLPTVGFSQPRVFSLKYVHELTESGNAEDERNAIMDLLPIKADYAAKPTHTSTSKGVWLVKQNTEDGITRFSNHDSSHIVGTSFEGEREHLVRGLSEFLHRDPDDDESIPDQWTMRNVNPGMVIEELFTDVTNEYAPPLEFCIFTIWGKVWVAQMHDIATDRWSFVDPNGIMLANQVGSIPDWLDFSELVKIAEKLGANKDMFRTDIFVGVPAGAVRVGASREERIAAVQIAVNECAMYPTTSFVDDAICEEGARLWIAGYKMGNYRVVPNTEVPPSFLETGSFALPAGDD
jgi:hypothetical protein